MRSAEVEARRADRAQASFATTIRPARSRTTISLGTDSITERLRSAARWSLARATPPVEGVCVDAGQDLQAGEQLRGPAAVDRVVVDAEPAEHPAAGPQGYREGRLQPERREDRALGGGLGRNVPCRAEDDRSALPHLAGIPGEELGEVGLEVVLRSPWSEVAVGELQRPIVFGEEADTPPLASEERADFRQRRLQDPVHRLGREVEEAGCQVRQKSLELETPLESRNGRRGSIAGCHRVRGALRESAGLPASQTGC